MRITSTRFGELEVDAEALITFPEGILGFPEDRSYLLLEHYTEGSPFKWLQSASSPGLAFLVIDPFLVSAEYAVILDADTARLISMGDASGCAVMAIVNVPAGTPRRMTANLKAPLVVNPDLRVGRQMVMGSQGYSMKEELLPRLGRSPRQISESEQPMGNQDRATA